MAISAVSHGKNQLTCFGEGEGRWECVESPRSIVASLEQNCLEKGLADISSKSSGMPGFQSFCDGRSAWYRLRGEANTQSCEPFEGIGFLR